MKKLVVAFALISLNLMTWGYEQVSPLGFSIMESQNSENDSQFPKRDGYVYGWRSSLFSAAHHRMVGLATAVFANNDAAAQGYVGGVQTAILFNTAEDAELGLSQFSVFCNKVTTNSNGVQISAFYNEVGGYFNGVQIGMFNEVKSECFGAQIGLLNNALSAKGVQLGLCNSTESLQGIQIGLFNLVKSSQLVFSPVVRVGW